MGKSSESGHAVNLSNCKLLIDTCTGFGADYDPSNTDLTITALTAQWTTGTTEQKAYITALEGIRQPVNERRKLFDSMDTLVTRILGELNSSKADAKLKADAKSIADDIRGNNAPAEKKSGDDGKPGGTISQSHTGYVQRANSFFKLVELLKTIPEYAPKKADLKTTALTALHASMETANNGIGAILNVADNALLQRNRVLYTPETGIVDTALSCKEYVKGLYGAASAEYKMVKKIAFKSFAKDVL